jgi:D-alanine-D-alanine ligase
VPRPKPERLAFRSRVRDADRAALGRLIDRTAVFDPAERRVALELLEERLARGAGSGYFFCLAEIAGTLVGYCAYGPVPLTHGSYDLYWIAVDPAHQGRGLGRALLERAERDVARRGGSRLYIETSSRAPYRRTRRFYRDAGYRRAARLADFYARGDHKLIFCKDLSARRCRTGLRGARC